MTKEESESNLLDYKGKFEFDEAMSFYIYRTLEVQCKEARNQGSIALSEIFEIIETKRKRLNKSVLPIKITIEF